MSSPSTFVNIANTTKKLVQDNPHFVQQNALALLEKTLTKSAHPHAWRAVLSQFVGVEGLVPEIQQVIDFVSDRKEALRNVKPGSWMATVFLRWVSRNWMPASFHVERREALQTAFAMLMADVTTCELARSCAASTWHLPTQLRVDAFIRAFAVDGPFVNEKVTMEVRAILAPFRMP